MRFLKSEEHRLYLLAALTSLCIAVLLVYSGTIARRRITEDAQLSRMTEPEAAGGVAAVREESKFLQILIDALNHPRKVEEIYNALPAKQRGGTDYEVFVEYLDLLRSYQPSQIQSLSPLPQRASERCEERLLPSSRPNEDESAKYYYLNRTNTLDDERLTIRILVKDQEPMLDATYMQAALDLHQHAGLYFAALAEHNTEALAQLVHSDLNDPEFRRRKARETLSFYSNYGFKTDEKPQALEIAADYLSFEYGTKGVLQAKGTHSPDITGPLRHGVTFERTGDGVIVRDLIPMPNFVNLRSVVTRAPIATNERSRQRRFELDELESSGTAVRIFSPADMKIFGLDYDPLSIDSVSSDQKSGTYYLRKLEHDRMRLVFSYETAEDREEDRDGQLIYLSLREASEEWSFKFPFRFQMHRDELLRHYPFLDVYDYRAGLSAKLGVRLDFDAKQRLQRVEYLAPEWLSLAKQTEQAKATPFYP